MKSVINTSVSCRSCTQTLSVKDVLDRVRNICPTTTWLVYRCPQCDTANHVQVRTGLLYEGVLDGVPAPCFLARRPVPLDNVIVESTENELSILAENFQWHIPYEAMSEQE